MKQIMGIQRTNMYPREAGLVMRLIKSCTTNGGAHIFVYIHPVQRATSRNAHVCPSQMSRLYYHAIFMFVLYITHNPCLSENTKSGGCTVRYVYRSNVTGTNEMYDACRGKNDDGMCVHREIRHISRYIHEFSICVAAEHANYGGSAKNRLAPSSTYGIYKPIKLMKIKQFIDYSVPFH